MSEFVEKWVAGFNFSREVIVGTIRLKKTAKRFTLNRKDVDRSLHGVIGYGVNFDHDDRRLQDTREAALNKIIELNQWEIDSLSVKITRANECISAVKVVLDAE